MAVFVPHMLVGLCQDLAQGFGNTSELLTIAYRFVVLHKSLCPSKHMTLV